jgi:dihydroorotase
MIAFANGHGGEAPVLFTNARILCPGSGRDAMGGLLVEDGAIADLGPHLLNSATPKGARHIDAQGQLLCPGLIDMQVFTGEPGEEHRETLATASRAAAAGGVTAMLCMPNTSPVIDDVALVHYLHQAARDHSIVRVYSMAAMTKGLEGREMTEIGLLKEAGAMAFTNGKHSVGNAKIMRLLMAYARDFDALIVHFAEDGDLADGGVMNEGEISSRLGLQGIPSAAETIMIERDLRLLALTGGRYHISLVSSEESLTPIRDAKASRLDVTSGVSVNHLTLNENDIGAYRTYCKIKPPLRREEDRRALVAALREGVIDVIVSSHDPQDADLKRRPFDEAADGAIGLETMLAAALQLYHNGEIELLPLLAAMTAKPADLLRLPTGRLAIGAPADLALVNLDLPWKVDTASMSSRSRNCPFNDRVFQGKVLQSWVAGRRVYHHAEG